MPGDMKAIAVAAADCLDADIGRAPEVVDGRAPGGVDRIAVLLAEGLRVGADANRPDIELTRDRRTGKVTDHRGVAHKVGRSRVRHRSDTWSNGSAAGITTVSINGLVPTSNNGVLACGGPPASSMASRAGRRPDPEARSARTCHRQARQASVTKCSQSHTYTPRTPLEPPELNTWYSAEV